MTTDRDPLTSEELAAGDGYEPAMDDIDCTPRQRRNETREQFAKRTRPVIDGVPVRDLEGENAALVARMDRLEQTALRLLEVLGRLRFSDLSLANACELTDLTTKLRGLTVPGARR